MPGSNGDFIAPLAGFPPKDLILFRLLGLAPEDQRTSLSEGHRFPECAKQESSLVLRFVNAATHSFPETEHFHRGLRPYGAPLRSCSSRDSAEPRRAAAPPRPPPRRAPHPLCIRHRICGMVHLGDRSSPQQQSCEESSPARSSFRSIFAR